MRWSTICAVLSISMLSLMSETQVSQLAAQESIFPDKNLEAVVRQYVFEKKNTDKPLVEDDVVNISTIKGRGKGIKDLKGLEKCRSLRALDLADNNISNLSPISELTLIQSLILFKNEIADIKPIAGLVKLQHLELSNNQISDLSALSKLEKLRSLYLSNNKFTSLEPVGGLDQVWSLYADGNQIADLKPITGMKTLDSLDVRGNQVADLGPLKGHERWRFLFLDSNKITDLNVLVETAKAANAKPDRSASFWQVFLTGNPLSDEAKTKQLEELRKQTKLVDFK